MDSAFIVQITAQNSENNITYENKAFIYGVAAGFGIASYSYHYPENNNLNESGTYPIRISIPNLKLMAMISPKMAMNYYWINGFQKNETFGLHFIAMQFWPKGGDTWFMLGGGYTVNFDARDFGARDFGSSQDMELHLQMDTN